MFGWVKREETEKPPVMRRAGGRSVWGHLEQSAREGVSPIVLFVAQFLLEAPILSKPSKLLYERRKRLEADICASVKGSVRIIVLLR